MKGIKIITSFFCMAILAGCGNKNEETTCITVDVAANYPEKELILQDFVDVDYVPLETTDDFVMQGSIMAIGDRHIVVKNWSDDGNIYIFDRKTGKGLQKINRKGQGDEEYNYINGIILDEDKNEMFVNCAVKKKIYVYDLEGHYKRSFHHPGKAEYLDIFNYDKDHLIGYDMSLYYKEGEPREKGRSYHHILSKEDGSITRNLYLPFEIIKTPAVKKGDGVAMTSIRPIIPYEGKWLLVETSSDTVYSYAPETDKRSPFLIKKPTQDPEILLTMGAITDRYYFMHTVKKVFDFTTGRGFFFTDLVYDKQENAFFEADIRNDDFVKKQSVNLTASPINTGGIAAIQTLAANQLVEAYQNDGLKGKLKEVASHLDEEANPVVMVMKYKK